MSVGLTSRRWPHLEDDRLSDLPRVRADDDVPQRPKREPVMRVDPALADFARDEVKRQLGRSTRISHVEALQVGGHHAVLLMTVEPSSRRLVLKVAGPGDKRAIDYDRTD